MFLNPQAKALNFATNAAALVVFANTGGMPTNNNAGRVIKLPPPAKEFKHPAKNAAKQTKRKLRISTL